MLGQVAARALRPAIQSSLLVRQSVLPAHAAGATRLYAKYSKPKYQAPGSEKPTKKAAAIPKTASTTGSARQTSPGTSIPQDNTWKPKDAIKFGGPAAATGAASSINEGLSRKSDAELTEELDTQATPSANSVSDERYAAQPHRTTSEEPTLKEVQDQISANEELQGPHSSKLNSDPSEQQDLSEPSEKLGPLPDLRQGIPSTFAAEYLGEKVKAHESARGESSPDTSRGIDITPVENEGPESSSSRGSRGGRRGQDEYEASDYETSTDRWRAKMINYLYVSIAALFATGSVYLGRPYGEDENVPSGLEPANISSWSPGAIYARIMSRMGGSVEYYTEPTSRKLLPDVPENQRPPFTLVLSLEDLLIHSEWTREHGWRTAKRPGVDYFLRYLSQYYELVVFTTVPYGMGDPVLRKLDPFRVIMWPLFREATKYEKGKYIKDLAYLNRPLDKVIMIDTKQEHVANQPENAIVIPKWNGDAKDPHVRDLVALIPFLEYVGSMGIQDTRKVLESFSGTEIPQEFARREALARQEFQAQLAKEQSSRPKKSLGGLFNSAFGMKSQAGGMTFDNETTVAEGLSQGKMLSDQIRERGQREYERLEAEIRKNGEQWLKDMEEEEKRLMESSMKDMRKSWLGGVGGGSQEK